MQFSPFDVAINDNPVWCDIFYSSTNRLHLMSNSFRSYWFNVWFHFICTGLCLAYVFKTHLHTFFRIYYWFVTFIVGFTKEKPLESRSINMIPHAMLCAQHESDVFHISISVPTVSGLPGDSLTMVLLVPVLIHTQNGRHSHPSVVDNSWSVVIHAARYRTQKSSPECIVCILTLRFCVSIWVCIQKQQ